VLEHVSVRFEARATTAVLGPNGAGKPTLLRIAAGLLRASAGDLMYGERLLRRCSAAELARTRALLSQRASPALRFGLGDA
jgi:iron complex transport system ATP-binding protein